MWHALYVDVMVDYGAVGDGATSDKVAFQNAIDDMIAAGGGTIYIPGGYTFNLDTGIETPTGTTPIRFLGDGYGSKLLRGGTVAAGKGLINIKGSNVTVENLLIDGAVTSPTGLLYSDFSSDPMHSLLTANTSIWIHPGCSGIRIHSVWVEHTGGYAVLIDSDTANVTDIEILDCWFRNNRPHLFGTSGGDKTYGSWTGGVFWRGDCRTSASKLFSVRGLTVRGCHWRRVTGNCLWGHSMGFDTKHTNINLDGNDFEDIGLDAILMGNVIGGGARGNIGHRVGYVTLTDNDTPNPKYLGGLFATFLDGGFGQDLVYEDNSCFSVNGDAYDMDGHRHCTMTGNIAEQPAAGSPQYTEDRVSLHGPAQNGVNSMAGLVCGNSQQNGGAQYLLIAGNIFINCGVTAIIAGYCKHCRIADNVIYQPSSSAAPIQLFSASGGTGDEWLCKDNRVEDNIIHYNGGHYCIEETGTGWVIGSVNRIFNNDFIGTTVGEFLADASSGSYQGFTVAASSWKTTAAGTFVSLTGTGIGNITISVINGYIQSAGGLVSLSSSTASIQAPTGGVTAKWLITTDSLFFIQEAAPVISIAGQARFYMDSTTHKVMVSENGGAYVPLVSSATVAGSDSQVQYNNAGAFGASPDFTWNNTTHILQLANAAGGFNVLSTSTAAIQAAAGGVTAKWLIATDSLFFIEEAAPVSSVAGQARVYMDSGNHTVRFSIHGGGYNWIMDSGGNVASLSTSTAALQAASGGVTVKWLIGTDSLFLVEEAAPAVSVAGQARMYMDSADHTVRLSVNGGTYDLRFGSGGTIASLSTSTAAIQTSVGGMTAKWLITTDSVFFVEEAAPVLSVAGQSRLYMDSTSHKVRLSQNGGAYVDLLVGATAAGADTYVQFNDGGVFGAQANFNFVKASGQLNAVQFQGTAAGAAVAFRNSGGSFLVDGNGNLATTSASTAALQSANGGTTSKWLIATDSLFFVQEAAPVISSSGQARLYMDSSSHTLKLSLNGGGYFDILTSGGSVTSLQGLTGALNLVQGTGVTIAGLTISIGQAVGTSNAVTFNTVTASGFIVGGNTIIDSSGNVLAAPGAAVRANVSGATIGFLLANSNFLVDGNGNISAAGKLNMVGRYQVNGVDVINSAGVFVGPNIDIGFGHINARGFNPYNSIGTLFFGQDYTVVFPAAITVNGAPRTTLTYVSGVLVASS
jgi:hypothetical protein